MSAISTVNTRPQRRVEGIVPERRLLGAVLLVIGVIVAAGFVSDQFDQYTLIAVSLTCLTGFGLSREYGYAIPAGITGGLGTAAYLIANAVFAAPYTPAVFFLSMAGGFLAIWILGLGAVPQEKHPWPLVPATILGAFGLAFAAGQPGAIQWIQVAIAAVIIVAGAGLLLRHDRTTTTA
jgi:drug/metabolite transporter (DMT)-like permease